MSLKLDRNVLQWFDYVFENEKTSLRHYNFDCTLKEIRRASLNRVAFILEKNNSRYWKLYFEIPAEVTLKLKQNIHPLFREYIYEQISLYNDNQIYNFVNSNILKVFNNIAIYQYNILENLYTIDFRKSFIDKCQYLLIGEKRLIDEDLYLRVKSKEVFDFFNSDETFNLTLSFDIQKNENLLDSLLELRKSIIINERI